MRKKRVFKIPFCYSTGILQKDFGLLAEFP